MRAWIEDGVVRCASEMCDFGGVPCPRIGRCQEGLTLINEAELERLKHLADAARKDYEAAKRMCGEHNPKGNPECWKALGYSKCLSCPLDWFSEIEEAVERGGEER